MVGKGMKFPVLLVLAALSACASAPPGPPLPAPVRLEQKLEEAAFERSVEIMVDESGRLTSFLKRSLLRDQRRHGQLSSDQMRELAALLDRWTPAAVAKGEPWGTIRCGEKQAAWARGAALPADLVALVKWLRIAAEDFRLDPER
jgi:hypothetical protein